MSVYSIDIPLIDVPLAELAVRRLIWDEAKHCTMANVRLHNFRRVCSGFRNDLSGTELNRRQVESCEKDFERFVTAYVSNHCGHVAHLVGEMIGVWYSRIRLSCLVMTSKHVLVLVCIKMLFGA